MSSHDGPGTEGAHANSPVRSYLAREVILILQRILYRLDFPDVPPAALENMKAMRNLAEEMAKLLHPISEAKRMEGRELWDSFVHAIVAIARKKRGVRLNAKNLKDLVEDHCPEPHLAFWLAQRPPAIAGLLRYVPEVRKLIEAEGVVFCEYSVDPDEEFRIVDTRHLKAHADIYRYIKDPWPGGRTCRFCGLKENEHVDALLQVEVERRSGLQMIGDTVVLQVGGALTHEICRIPWIELGAIAAKYSTLAEAQAADAAAGRVSRYEKVKSTQRLEAPA